MRYVCEHCRNEFEAEKPARFCCNAHRQAAHRRRVEERAVSELAEALTPTAQGADPKPPPSPAPPPVKDEIDEEQAIRDSFGYAASETRTRAERDAVAARIMGRASSEVVLPRFIEFEGELRQITRSADITEGDYIANEVRVTQEQLKVGLIRTHPVVNGKDRLNRTADYARWRYRGFLCGEVASL